MNDKKSDALQEFLLGLSLEELDKLAGQLPVIAQEKEERRKAWEQRKLNRRLSTTLGYHQKPAVAPLPVSAAKKTNKAVSAPKADFSKLQDEAGKQGLDISSLLDDVKRFMSK